MTLRILKSQMAALGRQTSARFIANMSHYLQQHFPHWTRQHDAAQQQQWLEAALAKSIRYGVDSEPEAAQLVLLFTVLGVNADEQHEWVKQLLTDDSLVASGKVRKLVTACRQRGLKVEPVLVYDHLTGQPQ